MHLLIPLMESPFLKVDQTVHSLMNNLNCFLHYNVRKYNAHF